jgi:anti-sigma factor ChrR (cupin superfamily)
MPFEPEELVVNVEDLPWMPLGEGAWGKVLRTCAESGAWTVMLKQAAGTHVPPHKHLSGADFYVLQGCIEYRGGVAKAGHFAREPMGAVHERTSFPEETVYLFTSYGPLAMYGPDGQVIGFTDAESMQALKEAQDAIAAGG